LKLKLDENLDEESANLLRRAGHDVTTVASQELWARPDREIAEICRTEDRSLITLDLDFANPFIFEPSRYPGIAVLRLPAKATAAHIYRAVQTLIGGLRKQEVRGNLWVVRTGRIRIFGEETEND
jgi:predicted nuclease of predicted toxin-antitoxin system